MDVLPALLLACAVLFARPTRALADMGTMTPVLSITKLKGTLVLYAPPSDNYYCREFKGAANQVKNLKSSNKKVVKAYTYDKYTDLVPVKPGKSTITFTYKGKKFKAKVTVKKYTNPVKSIIFGSKVYKGQFKSKAFAEMKLKAAKGKTIKVTPQKGWKVYSITAFYDSKGVSRQKTIKNGGKLPNVSAFYAAIVVMKNTETGGYEELGFAFD